jgi:hypothetical protein
VTGAFAGRPLCSIIAAASGQRGLWPADNMKKTQPDSAILDAQQAAFIRNGVTVNVAARDEDLRPALARAAGCHLSEDRLRLRVFVSRRAGSEVLDCVRRTHQAAVVFTQPSTHRSLQVKSRDAIVEAALPGDAQRIVAYLEAIVADFRALDYRPEFVNALIDSSIAEIEVLALTPESIFVQTPGPQAGDRVMGRA